MARIPYSAGEGGSFQPLPEGTYDFRINETILGNSRAGNPQLQLKMEVLDGPHTSKKVSCWYSLLPQSGWKIDALLEALKIEREDTGQVDDKGNPILAFDDEWLLDRCVTFDVSQREYNGKTNNDFQNERLSAFDSAAGGVDEQAQAQEAAPPAVKPAPRTMRRRPRPQRGN